MSRQPSPGPSLPHMHAPTLYHPPGLASNPQFAQKQKNSGKNYVAGITAGVEDVKYQAKYKELKKKVKEIESDNDRLYFKLLLAKKNIRRMNLERAILYERLAAVPPTPGRHVQELPPDQDPIFHQHPPVPPEHARVVEPNDPALIEYMRTRPDARLVIGPDGRVVTVEDMPPTPGPNGTVVAPQPPPHELPLVYGFRHDSGPGYDPHRHIPPLPPMIPLIPPSAEDPPELPPINDHHGALYSQPQPHGHPQSYSQSHGGSSHHSRSNSARPDLDALPGTNPRIESLPPAHGGHSPNMPGEGQGERSRRHDIHELTHPHGHPLPHPHVQIPAQNLSASPPAHSPASTRGSDRSAGRVHNHQRVGPGANINRDVSQREWEHERNWERDRDRDRDLPVHMRQELRGENGPSVGWMRDDGPPVERMSHSASRSGSPTSAPGNGGSRVPSRPTSGQSMAYDVDRSRPKAPRVSNLLGIDREPGYDDHDDHVSGPPAAHFDSRSRYVDAENKYGSDIRSPVEATRASSSQNSQVSRGIKRRHSEDIDEDPNEHRGERMEEDD